MTSTTDLLTAKLSTDNLKMWREALEAAQTFGYVAVHSGLLKEIAEVVTAPSERLEVANHLEGIVNSSHGNFGWEMKYLTRAVQLLREDETLVTELSAAIHNNGVAR